MNWEIIVEDTALPPPAISWEQLPFGRVFGRYLAYAKYQEGGWQEVRVKRFERLSLSPGTSALHYGQAIFEGLKAYHRPKDTYFAFRVADHYQRFVRSAERLVMPPVPAELFLGLLRRLLQVEKDLFPPDLRHALYIRPLYFAADPWLGVRPSDSYIFLIYLTPVGPYYGEPVRVYVEEELVRAAPGGTGSIKMAGNYSAAMLSGKKAQQHNCHVSLWLDAIRHELIEEFSTMNVFFVQKGPTLITPPLDRGTILPGITRDTVLKMAQMLGISWKEQEVSIHELTEGIAHGSILEVFGTGTAATIMPVRSLFYANKWWQLPPTHPIADLLALTYRQILSGEKSVVSEWIWEI
ncbi:MAG: branched-chain amino acid aminotransferase [Bacteroidia bacterium]|nr:branched-chain amino acid aminotransferase [Bacteroidia bacterium]MDW8235889.1 branched-chain amino acid aminotransferase [Bacteroidia bacterium]